MQNEMYLAAYYVMWVGCIWIELAADFKILSFSKLLDFPTF